MDSESHTLSAFYVVTCPAHSSWQNKSRYSSLSDLESSYSHAEERQDTLTAWSSLVQEIVGDGIPKASQPRVRGCFKVTVRFSGWPSSWISGGTKTQSHFYQSNFRHFFLKKKRKNKWSWFILTVDFQPGFSFHRASLVGRHTLEIPAVTGRYFVDHEGTLPCDRQVRVIRMDFQAVLEPAHLWRRGTWKHSKVSLAWKCTLTGRA